MRWIDCRDQSSLGSYLCGRTGAAVIIENSVFACVTGVCCESSPILRNSDTSQSVSWDWLPPDEDLHCCRRIRKRAIWSTVTLNSSHWIIFVTWIDYLYRFVSRLLFVVNIIFLALFPQVCVTDWGYIGLIVQFRGGGGLKYLHEACCIWVHFHYILRIPCDRQKRIRLIM